MGFAAVNEKHSRPMAKGTDALKAQEKKLANMTDPQLLNYFAEGPMKGYTPPMLYISVGFRGSTLPVKSGFRQQR